LLGAWMFRHYLPDRQYGAVESFWLTWSLVFGQSPSGYPKAVPMQVLYFVVSIIGLGVIAQGVVSFALILRDRRLNERGWSEIMASSSSNHVVLVGIGKLGYRCYSLLRRLGEPCVVVERSRECSFLEEV